MLLVNESRRNMPNQYSKIALKVVNSIKSNPSLSQLSNGINSLTKFFNPSPAKKNVVLKMHFWDFAATEILKEFLRETIQIQ